MPENAAAQAMSTAIAPMANSTVPMAVSARSYWSHRAVIRLSTTLDCWKNSCQGETVVPIRAMATSAAASAGPRLPPAGATEAGPVWWARPRTMSGTAARLSATRRYMARSHRRKLPVTTTAIRTSAAAGTETYRLTPK